MVEHKNPDKKAASVLLMFLLALVLGALSAAVVWLFVFAMGLSYEYIWVELPALLAVPFLPVIICVIGGLVIGLWEKYVWEPPMLLEESLEIISKEKRFPYKGLPKTVVSAFLPLAFGGSVGPEAGLVNIIAGLCTWVGDKLKSFGVASAELAEAGLAATLTALFGAPVAGLVAPIEGRFEAARDDELLESEASEATSDTSSGATNKTTPPSPLSKRDKLVFYIAAVVGGLTVMLLLSHYVGGGLGLPRFDRTSWQPGELLISIPLALVGILAGYLFHASNVLTGSLAKKMDRFVITRTVLCGLILGIAGSLLPYTLFSGEEQMGELIQNFSSMAAWMLILTGFVKICICPLCVNMGWRGGNIFPVIFAGVSLGYGIALITGLDPVFCVTVLATSTTTAVMRKPVLAVAVLLLCFPVADVIFMVIAALLAGAIPLPKALRGAEG